MIDPRLLEALADGQFHSGQALGRQLRLSRSGVWKQIKALENLGVEVFCVRGRGYRVPGGFDLIEQQQLLEACSAQAQQQLVQIELQRFADSTNLMALRDIATAPSGSLYIAEHQSAGRGRRGRQWYSPFAQNLYFSLLWRFDCGAAALEGLSLVVGLSLVEGLEQHGFQGLQLKWPNDLLCQGRKLAGILLEMQGDASAEVNVVIGCGINVAMTSEQGLPEDIQPWIDLRQLAEQQGFELPSRSELLAAMVSALLANIELFNSQGFDALRERWMSYHAFQDLPVNLHLANREDSGICRGVDQRGALLIEQAGQLTSYHGGEVTLRLAK